MPTKQQKPRSKSKKKNEQSRLENLNLFETKFRSLGFKQIAGLDEVGRGPLAGPVVACACLIEEGIFFEGIDDSKKLLPEKRHLLYKLLISHPKVIYGVGIVESTTIDQINIYQASKQAMREALDKLPFKPDYLLVDGMELVYKDVPCEKIIKGDSKSQSIAAASIIAKETRDMLMDQYHELYPLYGFDHNKGYATAQHLEAIGQHGPCSIHRRSFDPIKQFFDAQLSFFTHKFA